MDVSERAQMLTVGHSTHPLERLVELLRVGEVEAVADVRRFPGSRRSPHFNADRLREALRRAGVSHVELGDELGGRRGGGSASPSPAARGTLAGYAEQMRTDVFATGLARLEALGRARRTAVMCAEADWRRCHRRLISDVLTARGWQVFHLLADGGVEEHPLSILDRR